METLLKHLNTFYPLSTELSDHLTETLRTAKLSKRNFLLKAGHICRNIYFVNKGMLRCFYRREENEICSSFMKEGDLIISAKSFFTQQPACDYIQALEDSELVYISYNELQSIYRNFPEFNLIARKLFEKYYILSEQRSYILRMQRSYERYSFLMSSYPEIIQRVPSKYIASYLGITDVTLSNIKSKI